MWLTAFTVWECGTRSEGAERGTVRKKRRQNSGGDGKGKNAKTEIENQQRREMLMHEAFSFISSEIAVILERCHEP